MTKTSIHEQTHEPLTNYLRAHRLKTGLTQDDVAMILGSLNRDTISRHERMELLPSLVIALSYEVIYRVPVSEIFSGLAETIEFNIEAQLAAFEDHLGSQSAHGSRAVAIARKLQWLSERRSTGRT
jgi:DNA-binding XRE family transcriptional regulator